MTAAAEFDALVAIPRRDRSEAQNVRVRELAAILNPPPAPPAPKPTARPRSSYAIRTVKQAQTALRRAERDAIADHGEEAVEGAWYDIVRSVLLDAAPDVAATIRQAEGIDL